MENNSLKSLQEILASGIKHAGGLAQLAAAEAEAQQRRAQWEKSSADPIVLSSKPTSG